MRERIKRKRKWTTRLAILFTVLVVAGGVGWFGLQRAVKSSLESKLAALELGTPRIRSVSITWKGISATGIQFHRAAGDSGPVATLDALIINHPLLELITSSPVYESIVLDGLDVVVDLSDASDDSAPEIDLKSIVLPAKKLSIVRAAFVMRNGADRTFEIRDLELSLTSVGDHIETSGKIGSLLGGPWEVTGRLDPKNESLAVELTTDKLTLVNHQWQKWPFLPTVIEQTVHGDALMKAGVSIRSDSENGFDVEGLANIDYLNLKFPFFDNLPVNIYEGDIEFRNQTIYYKDIVATVDGQDRINGNGETVVDSFPIRSKFNGTFEDLELGSLRKLVAGIPSDVNGRATGDVVGSVDVEGSTRCELDISAGADCYMVRYGQIETELLRNETRIVDLTFDELQAFESVEGSVSVIGKTLPQPINRIFRTFDLTELERRMELIGDFEGDLELQLPLDTIADLNTWKLEVMGSVAEATICDQPMSGVEIEARLNNGELQLRPIRATPLTIAEASGLSDQAIDLPKLNVMVDWPLTEASGSLPGRVQVSGESVPTGWIRRFTDQQIENAMGLTREEIDPDRRWSFELSGLVDLEAQMEIPSAFPDRLESWTGTGSVKNASVVLDRLALNGLAASLELDKGLLSIQDAYGTFENGGQITANGHIDVRHQLDHQMDFTGRSLPFSWAILLAAESSEDLKQLLVESEIDTVIENGNLTGELSVDLELTSDPESKKVPWTLHTDISADRLGIGDAVLRNLNVEGFGNPERIQFDHLHVDLEDDGFIGGQGDWVLDTQSGNGSIEWQKLPVRWLSGIAGVRWLRPQGRTNGTLSIRSTVDVGHDPEISIPIAIDGNVSTDQINVGLGDVRPFSFDIATRDGVVYFENVVTSDDRFRLDLNAQAGLTRPWSFSINGDIAEGNLSRLIQDSTAGNGLDSDLGLTGLVAAKLNVDGQLHPMDWRTDGEMSLTGMSLSGRPMSDLTASWKHSNNNWQKTSFSAQALGGTIQLTELVRETERLVISISDLDAGQLASLLGSSTPVSGNLNGSVAINEWSNPDRTNASLDMDSNEIRAQEAMFRDISGRVEFVDSLLSYRFDSAVLGGRLDGTGSAELAQLDLRESAFPLELRATNINLNEVSTTFKAFRSFNSLTGNLSALGILELRPGKSPAGNGRIELNAVHWKNKRLVRNAMARFAISNDIVAIDDIRADLERGSVTGRVVIPTFSSRSGNYDLDVRNVDLGRLTEFTLGHSTDVEGQFSARINGRIGRQITGQGFVGVQRASIHGLEGQAFRLPVRYSISPQNQTGRLEVRQSTFRLFDGKATASATLQFGRSFNIDSNAQFSSVDTGKLLAAVADIEYGDQGKMSGRLSLNGRGIRSSRDLAGTFNGRVTRASAFELPVIQDVARFLSGNNIKTQDYDSDEIDMRLNKGRVEVNQLNFTNQFAKVAVRGNAFLDGRLDLQVAARVDKLGQPTLIEELAGSPLAGLSGSPVALITQVADFLSERVVFLRVNGTFERPQLRVDAGKQVTEEVIRYFLRGSQILPNGFRRND